MHCLKTIENEVHYVVYLLFVELPDILFFVFRIHYSKLATKGNEKSGYPLKKTLISHTRYLYILRSFEYKNKIEKKKKKTLMTTDNLPYQTDTLRQPGGSG